MIYICDPSSNFNSMEELKEIALNASEIGCNIFKPQLYNASELYSSTNNKYYEHQKKCSLSIDQAQEIFDYCNSIGIQCVFSVFSLGHLRWLEEIGCNTVKIAASVAGNGEIVSEASNQGYSAIISLSKEHKKYSVPEYRDMFSKVHFMSCVSKYPASISDYSLGNIHVLEGLSCHVPNISLAIAATSVGANIIEKHVYLNPIDSPDFSCSISMQEMKTLIDTCNEIEKIRWI